MREAKEIRKEVEKGVSKGNKANDLVKSVATIHSLSKNAAESGSYKNLSVQMGVQWANPTKMRY